LKHWRPITVTGSEGKTFVSALIETEDSDKLKGSNFHNAERWKNALKALKACWVRKESKGRAQKYQRTQRFNAIMNSLSQPAIDEPQKREREKERRKMVARRKTQEQKRKDKVLKKNSSKLKMRFFCFTFLFFFVEKFNVSFALLCENEISGATVSVSHSFLEKENIK